jgi:Asp-tRNA(Asn)/Glu-tRNA(Gln) amidotransferase A subunit family amidase
MNIDLLSLDASEIIQRIKKRELKASDYMQACLAQIHRYDPVLKAWANLDEESAMIQAAMIDQKVENDEDLKVLPGVPVGIKDIFNTIDLPTQMGSPIWKDFTPGNDARIVHYLRMANAIFPGKTVTAEFAVHTPGPTRNPHNTNYMAGTSSTGSAVAVAASMVPLSIGTQTAGSTIRPASYTGVYGFKPSFGMLPRTGMLKTTDTLDTVGMFSKSVRDLKLLFDVMRVKGVDYPLHEKNLSDKFRQASKDGNWRIGLFLGPMWKYAENYAVRQLKLFSMSLGQVDNIDTKEVVLPSSLQQVHRLHATLYDRSLAYYFKEEYEQKTLVSKTMYEIIERGQSISLAQYKHAVEEQAKIFRELDQFFVEEEIDILLDLATGGEALLGLDSVDRPDDCLIWSFCGTPVINLPIFWGPNGLPFGAQIISRRYSDYLLLSLAQFLSDIGLAPSIVNYPLKIEI